MFQDGLRWITEATIDVVVSRSNIQTSLPVLRRVDGKHIEVETVNGANVEISQSIPSSTFWITSRFSKFASSVLATAMSISIPFPPRHHPGGTIALNRDVLLKLRVESPC